MVMNQDYAMDSLFQNKEDHVLEIYQTILENIQTYGQPIIEIKKTSLHLVKKLAFLGVHPKKKRLDLNIVSDHLLSHSRLRKTEQISKKRYHNAIRLHHVEDIDDQLLALIKEAFHM